MKRWVRGYITRLRINCTNDSTYDRRRLLFREQLLARGYYPSTLDEYFQHKPARTALLAGIQLTPKPSLSTTNTPTVFKTRYSPRTATLTQAFKKALTATTEMLANPSLAAQLQANGRPLLCFSNAKNIGSKVVSAKLNSPDVQSGNSRTRVLGGNQ